jgi:transcriptional regulator with XRE-family HTH domain
MQHAGTTIIAARKALGITQAQLAELAGVNAGYLSLVESGQRTPSPRWSRDVHQAIAAALGDRGVA